MSDRCKLIVEEVVTAWDLDSVVFPGDKFSAGTLSVVGIQLKPDGTKMYTADVTGEDVEQWSLSTPWDVTTASKDVAEHNDGYSGNLEGFWIRPSDGAKLYVYKDVFDAIIEYNLSTPWDVSTGSYSGNAKTGLPTAQNIKISDDGDYLYLVGGGIIRRYVMSTPWNVSTMALSGTFSPTTETTSIQDVYFETGGAKMFVSASTEDKVFQYLLSTPWDVSTASYDKEISIATTSAHHAIAFKDDGTKVYMVDNVTEVNPAIWQHDLA